MSAQQQVYIVAVLLTVIGVVFVGVFCALAFMIWWCTSIYHDATPVRDFLADACGGGTLKEMAIALIGAVSTLWGANQLRRRP